MTTRRCGHCGGTGVVALTGRYAETLALIRSGSEVIGAGLARKVGIAATAMNNRLAAMEKIGLLTSRREGVLRLYRLAGGNGRAKQ